MTIIDMRAWNGKSIDPFMALYQRKGLDAWRLSENQRDPMSRAIAGGPRTPPVPVATLFGVPIVWV